MATATTAKRTQRLWDETRRLEFLATLSPFQSIDPTALRRVAATIQSRRVRRGEAVFLEGNSASALQILAEGRVKLIRETEDGREVILRLIRAGEMFGGAGIWGESTYPASAFAQEDSIVLQLSNSAFLEIISEYPKAALSVIQLLASRLRDAEARIRDLQTAQVEQRIANVVLRLASKTGVKTAEGVEIGIPITRQDLAELCGTTLSTASRTLSAWQQRGIVKSGRERITIRQPHGLFRIAEGDTP